MNLTKEEYDQVLSTIKKAAEALDADVSILHERSTPTLSTTTSSTFTSSSSVSSTNLTENASTSTSSTIPYCFGHVLIRQRGRRVEELLEIRCAVVGNVDAGKSTLLGVLTKDVLDDGRGKARLNLFRHKHEIDTGRTSSVGTEIMGFDSKGNIVTPSSLGKVKLNWDDICVASSKVNFIYFQFLCYFYFIYLSILNLGTVLLTPVFIFFSSFLSQKHKSQFSNTNIKK